MMSTARNNPQKLIDGVEKIKKEISAKKEKSALAWLESYSQKFNAT